MNGLEAKQRSTPSEPASLEVLRERYLGLRARHLDTLWEHPDGATLHALMCAKSLVGPDGSIFGCPRSLALFWDAQQAVEAKDRHILIVGERGVGKESIARLIAASSSGKLVSVNCATLTESIADGLLFGVASKAGIANTPTTVHGYVDRAEGGVLFLDEFFDADPAVLPKLLRLLEQREWNRVGDPVAKTLSLGTFIVAATNRVATKRDLYAGDQAIVRADLVDRFDVALEIAPLRDRREEIPDLCNSILQRASTAKGLDVVRIDATSANALRDSAYAWPGNVRELRRLLLEQLRLQWAQASRTGILMIPEEAMRRAPPTGTAQKESAAASSTLPAWKDREWLGTIRREQLVSALRSEMLALGRRHVDASWVSTQCSRLLAAKNVHQRLQSAIGLTASQVAALVSRLESD